MAAARLSSNNVPKTFSSFNSPVALNTEAGPVDNNTTKKHIRAHSAHMLNIGISPRQRPQQQTQQHQPLSTTINRHDEPYQHFDSDQDTNEADIDSKSFNTVKRHKKRKDSLKLQSPHTTVKQSSFTLSSPSHSTKSRPATSDGHQSPSAWNSPSDQSTSYFTLTPSYTNELRSPGIKRPPASRSANGVATSRGPPPAISTQRVFSFETQLNAGAQEISDHDYFTRSSEESPREQQQRWPSRGRTLGDRHRETETEATSLESNSNMDRGSKRYSLEGGSRLAAHRKSLQLNDANLALQDAVSNGSSHEDLFLNMAQVVGGDDSAEAERNPRSIPSHRVSLSQSRATEKSPASHFRRASLARPELATQYRTPPSDRMGTIERVYPSTVHPLDGRPSSRFPQATPTNIQTTNLADSPSVRREHPAAYHSRFRSTQLPNANTTFNSSPLTARNDSFDQDPSLTLARNNEGTESTVSTTAPSTVWDELDDLRSRIRKLEGTGKIPQSSNGSIDRPRTAATSNTTMSSSPRRNGMKSVSPTAITFDDASPHPLLKNALAKAKSIVSQEIYRALEITASDALSLAKQASDGSSHTSLERQLKRKADNMCRSLTELCIALSAGSSSHQERPPTRARSGSRDAAAFRNFPSQSLQPSPDAIEDRRFDRAQSLDPEPSATQRVLSRLEARRTSMKLDALNTGGAAQASPQAELRLELKTPTQATIPRTNTVLQRNRRYAENANVEDPDLTVRPISRATTDLARANTTGGMDRASKRLSREYTSNYPLPSPFTRNFPGVNDHAGTRRSYLTSGALNTGSGTNTAASSTVSRQQDVPSTPTTPSYGALRYRSRIANQTSGDDTITGRAVEPRQRFVSAGGQYTSARSYLSTRPGDRRSFVSVDDQSQTQSQLEGNQF